MSSTDDFKRPAPELKNPADYTTWKYLMMNFFKVDDEMQQIFQEKVILKEVDGITLASKDNGETFLNENQGKKFVKAEIKMCSLVIRCIKKEYAEQLTDTPRFIDMWKKVNIPFSIFFSIISFVNIAMYGP